MNTALWDWAVRDAGLFAYRVDRGQLLTPVPHSWLGRQSGIEPLLNSLGRLRHAGATEQRWSLVILCVVSPVLLNTFWKMSFCLSKVFVNYIYWSTLFKIPWESEVRAQCAWHLWRISGQRVGHSGVACGTGLGKLTAREKWKEMRQQSRSGIHKV